MGSRLDSIWTHLFYRCTDCVTNLFHSLLKVFFPTWLNAFSQAFFIYKSQADDISGTSSLSGSSLGVIISRKARRFCHIVNKLLEWVLKRLFCFSFGNVCRRKAIVSMNHDEVLSNYFFSRQWSLYLIKKQTLHH